MNEFEQILTDWRSAYATHSIDDVVIVEGVGAFTISDDFFKEVLKGLYCGLGSIVASQDGKPTPYTFILGGQGSGQDGLRDSFRELAARSGAALPLTTLGPLNLVMDGSPRALWAAFLFHTLAEYDFVATHKATGYRVLLNPFAASIRAIELAHLIRAKKKRSKTRRRTAADRKLTSRQQQVYDEYEKCHSISVVATRLKIDRKTAQQHLDAAKRKVQLLLVRSGPLRSRRNQSLPTDRRGQADVSDDARG